MGMMMAWSIWRVQGGILAARKAKGNFKALHNKHTFLVLNNHFTIREY